MSETLAESIARVRLERIEMMRDLKAISTEEEFAEVLEGMPAEYRADLDAAGITEPEEKP